MTYRNPLFLFASADLLCLCFFCDDVASEEVSSLPTLSSSSSTSSPHSTITKSFRLIHTSFLNLVGRNASCVVVVLCVFLCCIDDCGCSSLIVAVSEDCLSAECSFMSVDDFDVDSFSHTISFASVLFFVDESGATITSNIFPPRVPTTRAIR